MNKITIKNKKESIEFGINRYKYLLGDDYTKKYNVIQAIKKYFDKGANSEYAIDYSKGISFKMDDKEVDLRKWKLFSINPLFDFKTEMKLGSKSIIVSYLEAVFKDIEYDDLVNTLRIIKNDLANHMNEKIENVEEFKIAIKFEELTLKNLIKQMELNFHKSDKLSNEYDFQYDDLVIFQLNLIYKVVKETMYFTYICIVEIPSITERIKKEIEKNSYPNLMMIVVSNDTCLKDVNVANILSVSRQIIDFSNEVSLYNDVILNLDRSVTIEELREYATLYFSNTNRQDDLDLISIL